MHSSDLQHGLTWLQARRMDGRVECPQNNNPKINFTILNLVFIAPQSLASRFRIFAHMNPHTHTVTAKYFPIFGPELVLPARRPIRGDGPDRMGKGDD